MHILLNLLKIAGISVLVLLLLLIFLLVLLLFVPFRYRIYGHVPEKASGDYSGVKVTVRFLMCLLMASWEYAEGEGKGLLRILGIPVARTGKEKQKKEKPEKKKGGKQQKREEDEKREMKLPEEAKETEKSDFEKELENGSKASGGERKEEDAEAEDWENEYLQDGKEPFQTGKQSEQRSIKRFLAFGRGIGRFWEKAFHVPERMMETMKHIRHMGRNITDVWTNQHVRNGVSMIRKQCGRLLMHLKPRRIHGRIHFGCSDPAATGQVLGILGIVYSFYGDTVRIEPDFEQAVFDGELEMEGRIQVFVLLGIAWKLYRDREVQYALKRIKNIREDRKQSMSHVL